MKESETAHLFGVDLKYEFEIDILEGVFRRMFETIFVNVDLPGPPGDRPKRLDFIIEEHVEGAARLFRACLYFYLNDVLFDYFQLSIARALDMIDRIAYANEVYDKVEDSSGPVREVPDLERQDFIEEYLDRHGAIWREMSVGLTGKGKRPDFLGDIVLQKKLVIEVRKQIAAAPSKSPRQADVAKKLGLDFDGRAIRKWLQRSGFKTWANFLTHAKTSDLIGDATLKKWSQRDPLKRYKKLLARAMDSDGGAVTTHIPPGRNLRKLRGL